MINRYGDRQMEMREGKWCDVYEKHYFEVHIGVFNKWGFLSVLAVVLGGVIIILNR